MDMEQFVTPTVDQLRSAIRLLVENMDDHYLQKICESAGQASLLVVRVSTTLDGLAQRSISRTISAWEISALRRLDGGSTQADGPKSPLNSVNGSEVVDGYCADLSRDAKRK